MTGLLERGGLDLVDAEATLEFGRALGRLLRAGDLVVMTGDLGAGKTTMTRGIGEALEVRGAVTSPTFVIAREHPPLGVGPALVHVDAYRLGGLDELDDLDLDTSLDDAVTIVEWGSGLAESLAENRLHVTVTTIEYDGTEARRVDLASIGPRWAAANLTEELGLDTRPVVAR